MRAVAIFLVFYWHFVHLWVPWEHAPGFFLFSIVEEGHTGVALFMVLSGYLFARLTEGKDILYGRFLFNRFLRLTPMLCFVFLGLFTLTDFTVRDFFEGFLLPYKWKAGAWSIAIELQFYVLFPFLVVAMRKWGTRILVVCLLAALITRLALWNIGFDAKTLGYSTLAGRIDQFLAGMLFSRLSGLRHFKTRPTIIFIGTILAFGLIWHVFNLNGGYTALEEPAFWIVIPLVEALAFGTIIAAYENMPYEMNPLISKAVAHVGCVSYSLYLIHIFLVETIVFAKLPSAPGLFEASAMAIISFPFFVGLATLTYRCIEEPALQYRCRYLVDRKTGDQPALQASASANTQN